MRPLSKRADFVMITELHGTVGSQSAFVPIHGTTAFWAAGTASRGGVGTIVKDEFRDKSAEHHWATVVEGRLASLTLVGPERMLHLIGAYFPTGARHRKRR